METNGIITNSDNTTANKPVYNNIIGSIELGKQDESQRSPINVSQSVTNLKEQIKQFQLLLQEKESVIQLLEREKNILEKEKFALKNEADYATKEKEAVVMRFATKEKQLIDLNKDKEYLQKLLDDSKREIKNITSKYHSINDEKTRLTSILDDKCNEIKRLQKCNEKLKTDVGNLEMKLKWNTIKLNQEIENKSTVEKKVDENNEKITKTEHDQRRIEQEANMILLKHENEEKEKQIDFLRRENREISDNLAKVQEELKNEEKKNLQLTVDLERLKNEYNAAEASLSKEMLNASRLQTEMESNKILKAQNTLNQEKIVYLTNLVEEKDKLIDDYNQDIEGLRKKETELLSINKEMTEMIVGLQNQIYLQNSKIKAVQADNDILRKEKLAFDKKIEEIETKLNDEIEKKNEERLLVGKHLSEKTKLCEITKVKLDNAIGELEATKKKHSQIVKELQREVAKYSKKYSELIKRNENNVPEDMNMPNSHNDSESEASTNSPEKTTLCEPSKQHLVERILRLQQAAVKQTEKIDFLENHAMSLVSELQKKSKILQYYMLRDQAGALTSSKSDQNKSELAKYGGVMSAIYTGIKGNNQNMTLELSLEINKKLQAVLEDTLLKNITLKENLDVMGLEIDKLTRQLAKTGSNYTSDKLM